MVLLLHPLARVPNPRLIERPERYCTAMLENVMTRKQAQAAVEQFDRQVIADLEEAARLVEHTRRSREVCSDRKRRLAAERETLRLIEGLKRR